MFEYELTCACRLPAASAVTTQVGHRAIDVDLKDRTPDLLGPPLIRTTALLKDSGQYPFRERHSRKIRPKRFRRHTLKRLKMRS